MVVSALGQMASSPTSASSDASQARSGRRTDDSVAACAKKIDHEGWMDRLIEQKAKVGVAGLACDHPALTTPGCAVLR